MTLALPLTTSLFLLAVIAHLGFFDLERLARGFRNLGILGAETLPPDVGILPTVGATLWKTIEMSFAGTLLGFLASLPLSILGTRRLFSSWVSSFARFVAAGIRTVPVLLWATIFVILVGLGPLAGTFGIGAYTVGYLAKIYADLFEGTDPEIIEAPARRNCSWCALSSCPSPPTPFSRRFFSCSNTTFAPLGYSASWAPAALAS